MEVMQSNEQQASWSTGMQTSTEQTVTHSTTSDTNDGFFGRPVKIYETEWAVNTQLFAVIDPWTSFFEDSRVANRLCHFKNLRSSLHVYAVINGNPFYYGRAMMSYAPLPDTDEHTHFSQTNAFWDAIEASQRPHVLLDPCKSEGGEIICPFIYPKTYIDIPSREWRKMGNIHLFDLNPLRHANNGTESITISIFAYASEVDISTPTSVVIPELQPQGEFLRPQGEYGKLSGMAHSIASFMTTLSDVPVIGPYARATELISSGVGQIASLFGFSRPNNVDVPSMRQASTSLSIANSSDNAVALAMDAKKEVTVDPRTFGFSPVDEMALLPMAMRESYFHQFTWLGSQAADSHLCSVRVSPVHSSQDPQGAYHVTPATFVALPFSYWKGTLNFRVQVVASAYHRGRLRIVWDPDYYAPGFADKFNTNYSMLLDITESQDVTFSIGWGQTTDYLPVEKLQDSVLDKTNGPSSFSTLRGTHNGVLAIYVVNPLTSPSDQIADVAVNMYLSSGDDFEIAGPRFDNLTTYKPVNNTEIVDPADPVYPGQVAASMFEVDPWYVISQAAGNQQLTGTQWLHFESPGGFRTSLRGGNSDALELTMVGDGQTRNVVFKFENPTSTATDIEVNLDGNKVFGTLQGLIGATLDITVPYNKPTIGLSAVPLSIERSGGAGRIYLRKIVLPLPDQAVPTEMGSGDINTASTNTTVSSIDGVNTNVGDADTTVVTTMPADYLVGSRPVVALMSGADINGFNYDGEAAADSNQMWLIPASVVGNTITFEPDSANVGTFNLYLYRIWYLADALAPQGEENLKPSPKVKKVRKKKRKYSLPPSKAFMKRMEKYDVDLPEHWRSSMTITEEVPDLKPEGENDTPEERQDDANDANAPLPSEEAPVFMGPKSDIPGLNQIYFGEQIVSWREVLKRYTTMYYFEDINRRYLRWNLPLYPLLKEKYTLNSAALLPAPSIFNYVISAYVACRGSMRYKIANMREMTLLSQYIAKRIPAEHFELGSAGATSGFVRGSTSLAGYELQQTVQRPFGEFEIPWYSLYRFFPARSLSYTNPSNSINLDGFELAFNRETPGDMYCTVFGAIGEDFQCCGFLCTPLLTIETFDFDDIFVMP